MLDIKDMHDYQRRAVLHQCTNPSSMLWLDMGLGKTSCTLTSIAHLKASGYLNGVIVVAPIRVVKLVWRQEVQKWKHLQHLTFKTIVGDKDARLTALLTKADIHLINYENLGWLATTLDHYFIQKGKPIPFDGIVWDEVSKMKNSTTNRVKSFMKIIDHFKWLTGLTGTPSSNGYKDLHGQFLVVDKGVRLGVGKTQFKNKYFHKVGPFKEVANTWTEDHIKKLIGDITLEMSATDYLKMPDFILNDVLVELCQEDRKLYDSMERELFLQLDNGTNIELFNAASLTNKALQFSNGAVYPNAGNPQYQVIHDLKLDALEEIIDEAQGSPILLAYAFQSDAERIMERFKDLRPVNLTKCKSQKSLDDAITRWQSGDCQLMIGHPASMGFGLDGLQKMGNILVWFGLTWSLDMYMQFNARLLRQGQKKPVMCHRIMTIDTMDQAQSEALKDKSNTEQSLRKAVNEYRIQRGM